MSGKRICFVGWADHVHLERWAGYFAGRGFEVCVISFSGTGRYPAGVRQLRVGLEGRGPRWVRLKLRYLLSRLRPDLVHVHWAHFAVAVREVWRGPLVVTAWGSDIYRSDSFSADQWRSLGDAMRTAQLVTCDSADLARAIQTGFDVPAERVAVVQWGVDTDLFCLTGPDLRAQLGLEGREVVLSARNFTPIYNQETVVAAFAMVRRSRPKAFLLMKRYGGDADYLAHIRADITSRGLDADVLILGDVGYEEMPALYRTADVMVSIPWSDAAPMSLLEAMASGVPSVVCDLPSLREWVSEGETGFLVDPGDASSVAASLVSVLEDGQRNEPMRRRARALVVERASQSSHMKSMADHYLALAR